jgi:hypothetical protein
LAVFSNNRLYDDWLGAEGVSELIDAGYRRIAQLEAAEKEKERLARVVRELTQRNKRLVAEVMRLRRVLALDVCTDDSPRLELCGENPATCKVFFELRGRYPKQ